MIPYRFLILTLAILCGCSGSEERAASINKAPFGELPDGRTVDLYELTNSQGMTMKVMTYGGTITSLTVPDRNGELGDIVLGYDNLQGYLDNSPFFGAIIGRYGNRIANGEFSLDSVVYTLAKNNGPNHLHGGALGYDKVLWEAKPLEMEDGVGLEFSYVSIEMEEGYPGTLEAKVSYLLNNDNSITFDYQATTDKKTIVNLTQHSYFNLNEMQSSILDHELMLPANTYLPVDSTLIPTGELRQVSGTPFDFTLPKPIGKEINSDNEQLDFGLGYDHNWILNRGDDEMALAAELYDNKTGRLMSVYTNEPGIQFYSGNFLDGTITGKEGITYDHRWGLCLETQHYPDSPNQPDFPTTVLNPGEVYRTSTRYVFSVK